VERKYEFTGEEMQLDNGVTVRRIRAIRSFGSVKAGDLGGWIEKEVNLYHNDAAWVTDNASVYEDAIISGDAWVEGNARVYGVARICGHARVCGNAEIFGYADVRDHAIIAENAKVYDSAKVCGNARVYDSAKVYDFAEVYDNASAYGNARIFADIRLYGGMEVDFSPEVSDNKKMFQDTPIAVIEAIKEAYLNHKGKGLPDEALPKEIANIVNSIPSAARGDFPEDDVITAALYANTYYRY
jgi:carbonic anhydrase/acetyltransferase-like protein (isoleucine patch superfamily)